jgi:hypothetical protein
LSRARLLQSLQASKSGACPWPGPKPVEMLARETFRLRRSEPGALARPRCPGGIAGTSVLQGGEDVRASLVTGSVMGVALAPAMSVVSVLNHSENLGQVVVQVKAAVLQISR